MGDFLRGRDGVGGQSALLLCLSFLLLQVKSSVYKDENKERKKQARKKGSAPLAPVCVNIDEEDETEEILVKVGSREFFSGVCCRE